MTDPDRFIDEQRAEITALDRAILEAVSRRLELVRALKRYKSASGIEFVDRAREQQILEQLVRANPGPLSEDAVRDLFAHILELMKSELARDRRHG